MYRYTLDPSSKKFICPSCGKKTYVRYIDVITKQYLDYEFGRCDREVKCRYFKYPGKEVLHTDACEYREINYDYIDPSKIKWGDIYGDNLFKFLSKQFGVGKVIEAFERYNVKTLDGYTVFPLINKEGLWHTAKMIKYNEKGKRIKDRCTTLYLHKYLNLKGEYKTCLFGEHLIDKYKSFYIVESEKTAIVGNIISKRGYIAIGTRKRSVEAMLPLIGKTIILSPDADSEELWSEWIKELKSILRVNGWKKDSIKIFESSDLADIFY